MVNLILASEMTGADIFVTLVLIATIGGLLIAVGYAIYEVIASEKNLKNAKKNQRLMFNQLKKGDFVWYTYGEDLNTYVVTNAGHYFDRDNTLKEIRISLRDISNEYSTRNLDIPVGNSQTFKHGDYYTIYNEANVIRTAIKRKRDEQRNAASKVSDEKLASEVNEVIKRLEKIKKEYK